MIIDKTKNILFYKALLPNIENGLQAVEKLPVGTKEGKFTFDGGFFLVQSGVTKPMAEGDFEAHRQYIDVQIVLEGSEEVAWANVQDLQETAPYDGDTDKVMYAGTESRTIQMAAGMCYVAFPQDAHKAVRHTEKSQSYRKIVMKLLIQG